MTFLIKSITLFILDVLVLISLGVILGRKRGPRFVKLSLGSIAVAVAYTAYDLLPRWLLGYLFVVPLLVAAAIVLMVFGRLSWKQAAAGSAVFFVTHAVVGWFV